MGVNEKPELKASCLFFLLCCSKESQGSLLPSELSVKCAFSGLFSLVFIAQEVNKPGRWLFGFWECFFSGRCLHLKQEIPSCVLSHQVNPSLKIGCCIICVFNAGYFEEFCKTLCSNSSDLTVCYMECYNLNPQFRCMKYRVLSACYYTPGTSIHATKMPSVVARPGFEWSWVQEQKRTGNFCTALVVRMGFDHLPQI